MRVSMRLPRCRSCERPVAQRWKRCPWCKGLTHTAWFPQYAAIDYTLNAQRMLGVGALCAAAIPAFFWDDQPLGVTLRLVAVSAGLVLAAASALHPLAWRLYLAAWLVGGVACVGFSGLGWAAVGAVLLALPAFVSLSMWRDVTARFEGRCPPSPLRESEVPRRGKCVRCDSLETELVAPITVTCVGVWCVRRVGEFRSVCLTHAREGALNASIISLLLGWWGLPWGPIWTAEALVYNLFSGGVVMSSQLALELRRTEAETGRAQGDQPVVDFVYGVLLTGAVAFFLSL